MLPDAHELKERIASLPPWQRDDFTDDEWASYVDVAGLVQSSDAETVEAALDKFMREAIGEEFRGYTSESKTFLADADRVRPSRACARRASDGRSRAGSTGRRRMRTAA